MPVSRPDLGDTQRPRPPNAVRRSIDRPAKVSASLLFRPDYELPRRVGLPLELLGDFLDIVDEGKTATVVVSGGFTLLPSMPGAPGEEAATSVQIVLDELKDWARGRRVTEDLNLVLYLMSSVYGRVLNEALLMHERWGIVLMRPADQAWLIAAHPTLVSEWSDWRPLHGTWRT